MRERARRWKEAEEEEERKSNKKDQVTSNSSQDDAGLAGASDLLDSVDAWPLSLQASLGASSV